MIVVNLLFKLNENEKKKEKNDLKTSFLLLSKSVHEGVLTF